MTAKARIEFHDVLHIWIEFRAPKAGELAWTVPANATPAEALEHVIVGRDAVDCGEFGFGFHVALGLPEFNEEDADDGGRTRNIVVHVDWVRSEPADVLAHVELL